MVPVEFGVGGFKVKVKESFLDNHLIYHFSDIPGSHFESNLVGALPITCRWLLLVLGVGFFQVKLHRSS